MSSQTGLTGLNSAAKNLDIIGNNIANANTVGYKVGRAEFADLIASTVGAGGGASDGIGVAITAITQQFTQGGINVTGNGLDVALNGAGFFQIQLPDLTLGYTRDGQFKLDKQGNLVTNNGASVLGFPTDGLGNVTSSTASPLSIPSGAPIPAKATTSVIASFNLDARSPIAASVFPPLSISTYGTTLNGYDAQGLEVPITLAFVRVGPDPTATPPIPTDKWDVYDTSTLAAGTASLALDAPVGAENKKNFLADKKNTALNLANGNLNLSTFTNPGISGTVLPALVPLPSASAAITPPSTTSTGALFQIEFDAAGNMRPLNPLPPGGLVTIKLQSANAALAPVDVKLDLGKTTQYGTSFGVTKLEQDGFTAGGLTGVTITETGKVMTKYSNGQTLIRGQLSLADFRNVQGLAQVGGYWIETTSSGPALQGAPGDGQFAKVRPGAVEESNVDLTAMLVDMMTAQRSYQANAQTIKTQDQALQTLVNLR
jgi:flagellar hook protein FlgE